MYHSAAEKVKLKRKGYAMKGNKCVIKYAPGTVNSYAWKWHLFGPDGTHLEYSVKAWAEMYAISRGWIAVRPIEMAGEAGK